MASQKQKKAQGRWQPFIALVLCLSWPATASAGPVRVLDQDKAVRAILGESGPTYVEMRAIAHALRNRGNFDGVYGLNRVKWVRGKLLMKRMFSPPCMPVGDCLKIELWEPVPASQYRHARMAWADAKTRWGDPVDGADHWLSDWDLKYAKPKLTAWRFSMVETAYIGSTHFYKEKK